MLRSLEIKDVGPARSMTLDLGERVNLVTGDNGVGKSFLLDVAWWALTRTWAGEQARPAGAGQPSLAFAFDTRSKKEPHAVSATFDHRAQAWSRKERGRPADPGLVIYAQVDGGFSVWDPARNYYRTRAGADPDRPEAYRFSRDEVWYGKGDPANPLCNGLVRDWERWQLARGEPLELTQRALATLAPPGEPIMLGEPAIIPGSSQPVPTLRSVTGQEVPITLASAGLRRICALAYLLVWTWRENRQQSQAQRLPAVHSVTFLVDELEAHLHPRWQRTILGALRGVVDALLRTDATRVQIIATTHSPLVMVSAEDWFGDTDAWFDLDVLDGDVRVERRPFERRGVASAWLDSEAFNRVSERAPAAEQLLERVVTALRSETIDGAQIAQLEQELAKTLGAHDPFWPRWRHLTASRAYPPPAAATSVAREPSRPKPKKRGIAIAAPSKKR